MLVLSLFLLLVLIRARWLKIRSTSAFEWGNESSDFTVNLHVIGNLLCPDVSASLLRLPQNATSFLLSVYNGRSLGSMNCSSLHSSSSDRNSEGEIMLGNLTAIFALVIFDCLKCD